MSSRSNQVHESKWGDIEQCLQDGDLDADAARLHQLRPKYLQASNFGAFADQVEKKNMEDAHASISKVTDAQVKVLESKWEYFLAGLHDDQRVIKSLQKASELLKQAEYIHQRKWREGEDHKAGQAVKEWMVEHLPIHYIENMLSMPCT
jgi:hypothetical protein